MRVRAIILSAVLWLLLTATGIFGQTLDISSGGFPTVIGSNTVMVTANSSTLQDLNVSINLGDISPFNTAGTIKITVPVAIRSIVPYQVEVASNGSFDSNPKAFQAEDIGLGFQNFSSMGINAAQCTQSTHDFRIPFDNNPESGMTLDSSGRVVYYSSVANIGVSSIVLSGPRLSLDSGPSVNRDPDNGHIFDIIFVVKPQFYAPGNFSLNLTFTISDGPVAPC